MIRRYIIEADDSLKGFDEAIEKLEREWGAEEIEGSEDCISREQAVYVASGYCAPQNIADELRKLPSVQPQPVDCSEQGSPYCLGHCPYEPQPKRGKWKVIRKEYEFMGSIVNEPQGCKCSNCGGIARFKSDFCPNCGADMREVQDDD